MADRRRRPEPGRWLLDTPREPTQPTALEPVWYLQIASLGPIAAREHVAFSDDPPVRSWLDGRGLELRGTFEAAEGVRVEIELGPRAGSRGP